jgi:cytoskeletal protein RodZ
MSTASPGPARSRLRVGLLVAAVVAVAAVILALVLTAGRDADGTAPTDPAGPTPSSGPTTSSAPTSSASGTPISPATSAATPSASTSSATAAQPSPTPTTEVPSPTLPPASVSGPPSVVPTRSTTSTRAPLREKADLDDGVAVRVSRIEPVEGEAQGPGEVAGPALRVSIEVQNTSGEDVAMDLALANLYYGEDKTPASVLSGPGASPLPGTLAAGDRASGRYVFGVPDRGRNPLVVEFSLRADTPTILFEGRL